MYLELQLVKEYDRGPLSPNEREKEPGIVLWPFEPYKEMVSEVVSQYDGNALRSSCDNLRPVAFVLMVLVGALAPDVNFGRRGARARLEEFECLMGNTPKSPVSMVVLSMLSNGPGEASKAFVSSSLRVGGQGPRRGMLTSSST
jgi:hypothetical protein